MWLIHQIYWKFLLIFLFFQFLSLITFSPRFVSVLFRVCLSLSLLALEEGGCHFVSKLWRGPHGGLWCSNYRNAQSPHCMYVPNPDSVAPSSALCRIYQGHHCYKHAWKASSAASMRSLAMTFPCEGRDEKDTDCLHLWGSQQPSLSLQTTALIF